MKYLIELPHHINDINVPSVKTFYINLLQLLEKKNFNYDIIMEDNSSSFFSHINNFKNKTNRYSYSNYDYIFKYHSRSKEKKIINIKMSYLSDYFYMDQTGYSGWATIASKIPDLSQIDNIESENFYNIVIKKYIINNKSKYEQPNANVEFKKYRPYVFLPTQVVDDEVSKLAYLNILELLNSIPKKILNEGYNVVIKRHPKCKSDKVSQILKELSKVEGIKIVDGSIHSIIRESSAVMVVNSGVGFEALMHLKPVINFGHCDYHWATKTVKSLDEDLSINDFIKSYDNSFTKLFLYYFVNNYLVDISSQENILKKIKQICK